MVRPLGIYRQEEGVKPDELAEAAGRFPQNTLFGFSEAIPLATLRQLPYTGVEVGLFAPESGNLDFGYYKWVAVIGIEDCVSLPPGTEPYRHKSHSHVSCYKNGEGERIDDTPSITDFGLNRCFSHVFYPRRPSANQQIITADGVVQNYTHGGTAEILRLSSDGTEMEFPWDYCTYEDALRPLATAIAAGGKPYLIELRGGGKLTGEIVFAPWPAVAQAKDGSLISEIFSRREEIFSKR
jgi:hypothetical protein